MLLILLILSSFKDELPKNNEGKDFIFTKLQRKEYLKNRQDPANWDKELFKFDKDGIAD